MGGGSDPIPPDMDDSWFIYLYEKLLEKEIKKFQLLFLLQTLVWQGVERGRTLFFRYTTSDSGLSSYYPNKKYAVKVGGT